MRVWVEVRRLVRAAMWGVRLGVAVLALCAPGVVAAQTPDAVDTPYVELNTLNWPGGGDLETLWSRRTNARIAAERLRRYPDSPHTVGWLMQAERIDDALDVLALVAQRSPARLPDAIEGYNRLPIERDRAHGYRDRLAAIVATARKAQASLGREDAARLDVALMAIDLSMPFDPAARTARIQRAVDSVSGTVTAGLLGIDLAVARGLSRATLAELDAIAAAWPRTEVAAKARYQKGQWLARDYFMLVLHKEAEPDPSAALFEVFDIVADLESGRYPPCRWAAQAPALITRWHLFRPALSPDGARRLLDRMHQFVSTHTALFDSPLASVQPSFFVTEWMPRVAGFMPDGAAVMAAHFDAFEREWAEPGQARLLRVSWLTAGPADPDETVAVAPPSATRDDDVRARLEAASQATSARVARRALARLAERDFDVAAQRPRARARYADYLKRFADADDAWIAAMRLAQLDVAAQRAAPARAAFERVAATYASDPLVVTLARGYAGRTAEAQNDFPEAARQYALALASWPTADGDLLRMPTPDGAGGVLSAISPATVREPWWLPRADVQQRLAELRASLELTGGPIFERGRWLRHQDRRAEALQVFEAVVGRYGVEGAGPLARAALGRTRIEAALDEVEPTNAAELTRALTTFDAVAAEHGGTTGALAAVAAATTRFVQGPRGDADRAMDAALARWVRDGAVSGPAPAAGTLEADVLAIRDAVFQPLGHPAFSRQWAGAWPTTRPRYVMALSSLRVRGPGLDDRDVDVARAPGGFPSTVLVSVDDADLLRSVVTGLATGPRREDAPGDATPLPAGSVEAILQWWNEYFPAGLNYQGGMGFLTMPLFRNVEFADATRSRALVPFSVGLSGATAVVEKVNGVWTLKAIVNAWIA